MNIEILLAQCGDFSRYQLMLLALFCLINVLASVNYYSQTIISFVPEHWYVVCLYFIFVYPYPLHHKSIYPPHFAGDFLQPIYIILSQNE